MEELPLVHHTMTTEQLWVMMLWFVGLCWFYVWLCLRNPTDRMFRTPLMKY